MGIGAQRAQVQSGCALPRNHSLVAGPFLMEGPGHEAIKFPPSVHAQQGLSDLRPFPGGRFQE